MKPEIGKRYVMRNGVPLTSAMRKSCPMDRGCVAYFPDALAYVAHVSYVGNQQHNQGEPMHWAREKSTDHGDCIVRHQSEAGKRDDDTLLHSGKVAWRSLAQLQLEIESAGGLASVLARESSNFPLPLILTDKPVSAEPLDSEMP